MTRSEISRASGVPESTLSRFVHGEREFGLTVLEKLAPTLGLTITIKKPTPSAGVHAGRSGKGKATPAQAVRKHRKRKGH